MPRTLLALGAHYDDCIFGIPGIMIKAARNGYRVVIPTMIGDYSNFAPARGRSPELVKGTIEIAHDSGAEVRFLGFKSHHFAVTTDHARAVAAVVADVRPDLAFILWPHDRHGDHGPASRLSETALRHAGALLDDPSLRPPQRIYAYDNGPRHTIGFEPDTYVDVTPEWPAAMEWLGRTMALAHGRPYDPTMPDVGAKQAIAAYRGSACAVRYAEALRALGAYPQELV